MQTQTFRGPVGPPYKLEATGKNVKLLPYDRLTFELKKKPLEVKTSLVSQVEAVTRFHWSRNHLPFQGRVDATSFSISPIIHYANPSTPVLDGRIEPTPEGTRVRVTMRPHLVAICLNGFLFGTLGLFGLVGLLILIQDGDPLLLLVCAGMGLFWYLVILICFMVEASRARRLLESTLGDGSQ